MNNKVIDCTASYKLSNGKNIPIIAFGTGVVKRFYRNKPLYIKDTFIAILRSIKHRKMVRFLKNDLTLKNTLDYAVKDGYRLFDSGRLYGHSEKYIGEVLKKYKREDYFVLTKVCEDDLKRYPNANTVHDNLTISLKFLQMDYVDAYLLHFPEKNKVELYREIEKEYKDGRVKAIGVSNFDIDELEELMANCEITPMINQIEVNPRYTRKKLVKFCQDNGILVMAHTPTARGYLKQIKDKDIMKQLMEKYNKNAPQIIYRWHLQNGIIPIVSTISRTHLQENMDIFDFYLTDDEMKKIDALDENKHCDRFDNKFSDVPDFIYNL